MYHINLTDGELKLIKSILRIKQTTKTMQSRCQIPIVLDEGHGKILTHEQSAKSNAACLATITSTVKLYSSEGIEGIIVLKRNVNSDNAKRRLDGRAEARLIEIACSPAPEGHSHRKATNWAMEIKYLPDVIFPDAEKIILAMDNLNTHKPASLYKTFEPAKARRIIKRLEIHYTPKHGGWLDMAEIELNVMTRQCLSRRIETIDLLQRKLTSWEEERNKTEPKIK